MIGDEYDTLRDWLRMRWIPGDPSGDDIVCYDDWLALPPEERSARCRHMTDDEADSGSRSKPPEVYIAIP